jgi:hypothetical protein
MVRRLVPDFHCEVRISDKSRPLFSFEVLEPPLTIMSENVLPQ